MLKESKNSSLLKDYQDIQSSIKELKNARSVFDIQEMAKTQYQSSDFIAEAMILFQNTKESFQDHRQDNQTH